LYTVATAGLGKSALARILATVWSALVAFPIAALLGILPAFLTAWLARGGPDPWHRGLGFALAATVGLAGLALGLILGAVCQTAKIPKRGWGICSGMTEDPNGKTPALVPWLSQYLDTLAGKTAGEPLTFGDLQKHEIKLQMISTNLTNGRPYTLPFGEHTHFYFTGADLRRFFPEYVVKWMENNPGKRSTRDQKGEVQSDGLNVLPDAQNLILWTVD